MIAQYFIFVLFSIHACLVLGRIASGTAIQSATKLLSTDALVSGGKNIIGATRSIPKSIVDHAMQPRLLNKGESVGFNVADYASAHTYPLLDMSTLSREDKESILPLYENLHANPIALSKKDAKKSRDLLRRFEKLQRQHAAKMETGQINPDNQLPKLTFSLADGSPIDIQYTQAFTTKHLGSPDRGPHSGRINTVLSNPSSIMLGLARNLHDKEGNLYVAIPGLDFPDSILHQLGISEISQTQFRRAALPSLNQIAVTTYTRTDEMAWIRHPFADSKTKVEFEGFVVPKGYGGLKRDMIVVDHMHTIYDHMLF